MRRIDEARMSGRRGDGRGPESTGRARQIRSFVAGCALGLAAAAAWILTVGLLALGVAGVVARARAGPQVFLAFDPRSLFLLAPFAAAGALGLCLMAIAVYRRN